MLPREWRPVSTRGLARVGAKFGGGYVLPERAMEGVETLVSCGLGFDWSFEEEFRRRSGCRVVCYDGTVSPRRLWREGLRNARRRVLRALSLAPERRRLRMPEDPLVLLRWRRFFDGAGAEHRRLNIGHDGNPGEVSFSTALAEFPDGLLFVKMDIEGAEYRALDALAALEPERLAGVAIEFHEADLHRARIAEWMGAMRRQVLVHAHAANSGGLDAAGDPRVIEMTFARDDLVEPDGGRPSYPRPGLDAPVDPSRPDLPLRFEGDG